jgi:hypothetical protein
MVDAQNDRLAVDDEMLLAVLQSGFNDPGETLGPMYPPRVISRTRSALRSTRRR